MSIEDKRCEKCATGTYIRREWKESLGEFGDVNVIEDICDTCGHDYWKEQAEKIQEAYLNGEID